MFPAEWYEKLLPSAAFGSVRLGVGEASVISATGVAEDQGALGRSTRVLAFQSKHLQVSLQDGRVVHFGVYFRHLGQPVVLPGLQLSGGTTVDDLREWMQGIGVGSEHTVQPHGVRLDFDNGVVAVFDEGTLDSLQVS